MRPGLILLLLVMIAMDAVSQKNNHAAFKLPANARYMPGRVLVKAKSDFRQEILQSPAGRAKNSAIKSIAPLVKPALARKGAAWRGPVAAQPSVDISRYFAIQFDPTVGIEDFINQLYGTGYFEIIEPEYAYQMDFNPNDPSVTSQYYLKTIKAIEAWDITQGSQDITIAIVDSGGDMDHPDLVDNLYVNTKEIPNNGIDDDNDGFVDNDHGWDFVGSDTLNINNPDFKGDNDPSIHSGGDISHGTMVAGCASARANNGVGIAGVGFKTKLMFTKHSADNQKTTNGSIYLGYSGVLYAANQGIKIINCSWGGPSQSQIVQDIINHVTLDLGCLVVAAAGNTGNSVPSYPAAYDNVLSVAATDSKDVVASFSTFGNTVDISAPGVNIFTTSFNNVYSTVSGTSFSSPIAAGAAALVWAANPSFTPVQVSEQLRVSADNQALYAANPNLLHQLGNGRLDIQRALTLDLPSVRASHPRLVNENGLAVVPGQNGFLTFSFTNYLKPTSSGVQVSISTTSPYVTITKSTVNPGIIASNATISNTLTPFELSIKANAPENTTVNLLIHYSDGIYSDDQLIFLLVNPSFIDVNSNLINTTVSAIGRIGYQDSDNSKQGVGFIFNEQSVLFEMGLIMGSSSTSLYNNVRGINTTFDQDFVETVKIKQIFPGDRSYSEIFGEFSNSLVVAQQAVVVRYRSLVWKDSLYDKFVILEYKIRNPTTQPINNFHFGIFADWDITASNDAANWYDAEKLGYVYPAQTAAKPYAGIQLLTGPAQYYAIENDQAISGNPFGLYDGFTDVEKFTSLSTQRLTAGLSTSGGTDVSHVVSSGPYTLGAGQELTLAFALHAAVNFDELKASSAYADSIYNFTLKAPQPTVDSVKICYQSPATILASGATKLKWYKAFTGGNSFFTGSQFTTPALTSDTTFYVSNADSSYESVRTPAAVILKANPGITTSGSTTLCDGQSVTLSATLSDSYLWSTGETTKTIQVSTVGDYSVTVKFNALSCESSSSPVTITVNPSPVAKFATPAEMKVFSPQSFVDQSTGAMAWYWQFGDGGSSSDQNPTHTYKKISADTVSLTVTASNGCQSTISNPILIITGLEGDREPIAIYPNPFHSEPLMIELSEKGGASVKLELINMLGQSLFEEEFQIGSDRISREIPVRNLVDGMYVVKIKVGERVLIRKVVKSQ